MVIHFIPPIFKVPATIHFKIRVSQGMQLHDTRLTVPGVYSADCHLLRAVLCLLKYTLRNPNTQGVNFGL